MQVNKSLTYRLSMHYNLLEYNILESLLKNYPTFSCCFKYTCEYILRLLLF